jgi:DNA topoisomerase IB
LVLAGCAGSKPPPPRVNLSGFPPAFQDGYAAGCESARVHATRRDEARFKSDRQYAAGWRDGLDACNRKLHPPQ